MPGWAGIPLAYSLLAVNLIHRGSYISVLGEGDPWYAREQSSRWRAHRPHCSVLLLFRGRAHSKPNEEHAGF